MEEGNYCYGSCILRVKKEHGKQYFWKKCMEDNCVSDYEIYAEKEISRQMIEYHNNGNSIQYEGAIH